MRALTSRELTVAAQRVSIPLAAFGVLAPSTAFVLVWTAGLPVFALTDMYEQTRALNWVLLVAVLPWTAVRSLPFDRRDGIALMAALVEVPRAWAILAKVVASFTVQVLVILTAVPALVLAQQAAAAPLQTVLIDLVAVLGLPILIAPLATAAMLFAVDGLRAWFWTCGLAVAIVVLAIKFVTEPSAIGFVCAMGGIFTVVFLVTAASRFLDATSGR